MIADKPEDKDVGPAMPPMGVEWVAWVDGWHGNVIPIILVAQKGQFLLPFF